MTGRRWNLISETGLKSTYRKVPSALLLAMGLTVAGFTAVNADADKSPVLQNEPPAVAGVANDQLAAPPATALAPAVAATIAAESAVAPVKVSGLKVTSDGESVKLSFQSSGAVRQSLKIEENPPAAVITLDNVVVDGVAQSLDVNDGLVGAVEVSSGAGSSTVTIKLLRSADVSVSGSEAGFDVSVVAVKGAPQAEQTAAVESKPESGVLLSGNAIDFNLGGEPKELAGFVISGGDRLVVDLGGYAWNHGEMLLDYPQGSVSKIAVRKTDDGLRAVLQARKPGFFNGYKIEKSQAGFKVVTETEIGLIAFAGEPEKQVVMAAQEAAAKKGGGEISDFGFRQDEAKSFVELALTNQAQASVTEATDKKVVVDIKNTHLPSKFQRALDTSAFNGPVGMVAAYQRGSGVRLVIELKSSAPFKLETTDKGVVLAFEGGAKVVPATPEPEPQEKLVLDRPQGANGEVKAPEAGAKAQAPGIPGRYTGQKISLDFVDADVRNVLRLIGDVSGMNIVSGSEVTGKISIRLIDVPWDQALDVILKTKDLGKEVDGNIMRIVSAERIEAEQNKIRSKQEMEDKKKEDKLPLISDIFPVNYAKADQVAEKIKVLLSIKGSSAVDERTNTILIRDFQENIDMARQMVARLDSPTPQVLIEARIVEVSSTYAKDLGVQWGTKYSADPAHGNSTGASFPNTVGVSGDNLVKFNDTSHNYLVNLPAAAATGGGPGGALALSLGHIKDIFSLDLRLSALESSGKGRVVSSPRVTTLDNKLATISQGISIPFTTATTEKIETKSIDYLLELKVTPHVTSDNSIVLNIGLKKDAPSTTFRAVDNNTPAKETREAKTEVLVKDGDTAVIGGIITDSQSNTDSGIPWFQNLPLLGWMFKSKGGKVDKTELIIFITPKIVRIEESYLRK